MIATALQFSGGKDSLATLHWWAAHHGLDDTLVMWVNTGLAYPDVLETIDRYARCAPHFLEIRSDAEAHISANGYPSDVIPVNNTPLGKVLREGTVGATIQPWTTCCSANIWEPLQRAVLERGIKRVVRGQRNEEAQKSPIRSGHVDEHGIEYVMPIETWSTADVFAYLAEHDVEIPSYYGAERTSRDCWSCTAFLGNGGVERIRALPKARKEVVLARVREIRAAIKVETAFMDTLEAA